MNWKLIISLSTFGLVIVIATGLAVVPPKFDWLYWLICAVVCIFFIVKKVTKKLFLHGLLTGLICGTIASIPTAVLTSIYLANNPLFAEQMHRIRPGFDPVTFPFLMVPFTTVVYGLFVGFFAWLAGRIFKKTPISPVA